MKDDVKRHKMADTALRDIAAEADAAFNAGPRQAQPFTARYPDLTLDDAYRITALANGMRVAKGYRPVGRKFGFTNRRMVDTFRPLSLTDEALALEDDQYPFSWKSS